MSGAQGPKDPLGVVSGAEDRIVYPIKKGSNAALQGPYRADPSTGQPCGDVPPVPPVPPEDQMLTFINNPTADPKPAAVYEYDADT